MFHKPSSRKAKSTEQSPERTLFRIRFGLRNSLALTYWIAFGWHGDDYDIGRAGLVIFTGALGGGVVACWVAGCGVGRFVRRDYLTR